MLALRDLHDLIETVGRGDEALRPDDRAHQLLDQCAILLEIGSRHLDGARADIAKHIRIPCGRIWLHIAPSVELIDADAVPRLRHHVGVELARIACRKLPVPALERDQGHVLRRVEAVRAEDAAHQTVGQAAARQRSDTQTFEVPHGRGMPKLLGNLLADQDGTAESVGDVHHGHQRLLDLHRLEIVLEGDAEHLHRAAQQRGHRRRAAGEIVERQ